MPAASDTRSRKMTALAGFMGAGKTSVGRALAQQMGWHFTDLDSRIEEFSGLEIPDFFERLGEVHFRAVEHQLLQAAVREAGDRDPGTVIALGGGTFAQPQNIEFLRASGVSVVWLECPLDLLFSRCATVINRPLFRDETGFRTLYSERLPFYQQAEFRVDSSDEPRRVAARILALGIFEQVKV